MSSDPSAELEPQISMRKQSIVKSVSKDGDRDPSGSGNITCPTITVVETELCVFGEDDDQQGETLLEFTYTDVLVDLTDDGTCVIATYQAICVAGVDDDTSEEDVICGVDCDSGSGS